MKRPIKFRGRFIRDEVDNEYIAENEMLYGGYVEIDGKPHIVHQMAMGWIISEVKPDSVAQFVGVDEVGNEVYEGDTVISRHGYTDHAELRGFPLLKYFKLKEAQS